MDLGCLPWRAPKWLPAPGRDPLLYSSVSLSIPKALLSAFGGHLCKDELCPLGNLIFQKNRYQTTWKNFPFTEQEWSGIVRPYSLKAWNPSGLLPSLQEHRDGWMAWCDPSRSKVTPGNNMVVKQPPHKTFFFTKRNNLTTCSTFIQYRQETGAKAWALLGTARLGSTL